MSDQNDSLELDSIEPGGRDGGILFGQVEGTARLLASPYDGKSTMKTSCPAGISRAVGSIVRHDAPRPGTKTMGIPLALSLLEQRKWMRRLKPMDPDVSTSNSARAIIDVFDRIGLNGQRTVAFGAKNCGEWPDYD